MAKFEKGKSGNPKGKKAGTPNKTTKEAKRLFNSIINNEVDNIKACLDDVRRKSSYNYLLILSKYLNYVYPKGLELTIDDSDIDLSKLSTDELEARLKAYQDNKNIVILPCNCKEGKEKAENLKIFMED